MAFFEKVKWFYYEKRRKWWYRHYKNCSLPCSYWSDKRETFEWVYYDKDRKEFEVQNELYEALGNVCMTGFTYHYKSLSYFKYREGDKEFYKVSESHGHNFNEVVKAVYDYPETFEISKEFLEEYSKQELRYLKRVQNYLRLIGLKDYQISKERDAIGKKWDVISKKRKKSILDRMKKWYYVKQENKIMEIEKFARFENSKILTYSDCLYMHIEKESVLKAMLDGSKNYRIFRYCGSRIGKKYFLLDMEENYHALIEFTEEEQIPFKNLTEDRINYKVYGDKNFKEYKEKLFKQLQEDDKFYEEKFTENTPVLYAKFKVLEKF